MCLICREEEPDPNAMELTTPRCCKDVTTIPARYITPNIEYVNLFRCTGIQSLAHDLFHKCPNLKYVSLHGCTGLRTLPSDLFHHCPNLTEFSSGECTGLQSPSLAHDLFHHCPNLQEISLYKCTGLQSLAHDLFHHCPNLEYVYLDECTGLQSLAHDLFDKCPNLEHIALGGCTNLLNIPPMPSTCEIVGAPSDAELVNRRLRLGNAIAVFTHGIALNWRDQLCLDVVGMIVEEMVVKW